MKLTEVPTRAPEIATLLRSLADDIEDLEDEIFSTGVSISGLEEAVNAVADQVADLHEEIFDTLDKEEE